MDPAVLAAGVFAAACDAGWNATIKRGLDPLATTVLISIGAAIVSAVLLPFVGLPAGPPWPWCGASVPVHLPYFPPLIASYPPGRLGEVQSIPPRPAPLETAIPAPPVLPQTLRPLPLP